MVASQHAKPPLWRRFGRMTLRGLRPIAAPILYRFRLHVQTAVDASSTGKRIQGLHSEGNSPSSLAAFGQRLDPVRTDGQTNGLTELAQRLDEMRAEQAARMDRLQLGIDALRRDYHQNRSDLHLSTNAASPSNRPRTAELAAMVLSRVDALLQRVSIPVGGDLLMRTPHGFLLVPMEDRALITGIWENGGQLEYGTVKVLTALLKQGDRVIDVGANIGLLTLPAAVCVGPTGRVDAVEPASRVSALLRETIAMNFEAGRVVLHKCAAGDAAGKATLNLGHHVGHSSLLTLPGSEGTEEVDVTPLDALIAPGQRVDLVKIDAEGFEPQVWRGMSRIVADNPGLAVIVEFGPEHLRRAGVTISAWLDAFQKPGFIAFEIDEISGALTPLRPPASLESIVSLNLLLLRRHPSAYPQLTFT